jgi:hypothetical protein
MSLGFLSILKYKKQGKSLDFGKMLILHYCGQFILLCHPFVAFFSQTMRMGEIKQIKREM